MKKTIKTFISIGLIFLVSISMMLVCTSCSKNKVTKTYDVDEKFSNISISVSNGMNVYLEPSSDDKVRVVLLVNEKVNCNVTVDGDNLIVNLEDTRNWLGRILEFHSPDMTIYLPAGKYGDLNIKTSTGNTKISSDFSFDSIFIEGSTGNITCDASATDKINIQNTTGNVVLNGVVANTLDAKVSTGSITLNGVVAHEKMTLNSTTGNIRLNECDAGEIYAKATTGSIKGVLLTPKIFLTDTSTGSITVPHTTTGGVCDLSTSTGTINISIK